MSIVRIEDIRVLQKVVDFGTNQKRVSDFLILIGPQYSTMSVVTSIDPMLPRFIDTVAFVR